MRSKAVSERHLRSKYWIIRKKTFSWDISSFFFFCNVMGAKINFLINVVRVYNKVLHSSLGPVSVSSMESSVLNLISLVYFQGGTG